ncbi:helix-turn-helix domain-containing protein [Streptacidiphilus anmyonensis]|uniref:helix-turn-helix domain-containing protein n=1 Tax=Streptacidiphilus anmyonensis TaxID=405782 RepID=UPI0005AB7610|nr:helix-turn-helix transcriptional regulator [Streptacidiphilus anmyonensis]
MSTAADPWSVPACPSCRPDVDESRRRADPPSAERRTAGAGEDGRGQGGAPALDALPAPSLRLLAAMAVLEGRTPLPILAAIADVAEPHVALNDLITAGFVAWQPRGLVEPVAIHSQAARDAVYDSLPAALCRATHLAAADRISGIQAFRHAVLAVRGPDARLAARLETEATRYHRAGDTEQAGTLLLWSADLSTCRSDRERRLLTAAGWGTTTPAPGWSPALAEQLTTLEPSVERNLFLGRLAARQAHHDAAKALLDQARPLAGALPAPARTDVELATMALLADTADHEAQESVALSLLAHSGLDDETRQWSVYFAADAGGRLHGTPDAALCRLAALAPGLGHSQTDRPGQGILRWARGMWLAQSGRSAEAVADLQHVLLHEIDTDVEAVRTLAHAYLGHALFHLGDWQSALLEADESRRLAEARRDCRGGIPAAALTACLSALRGEWGAAEQQAAFVAASQRVHGPGHYAVFPALAAACLAYARGESAHVLTALVPVSVQSGPAGMHHAWWRPLQLQALIDTGRLAEARTALAALREAAGPGTSLTVVLARLEARLTAAEGNATAAADQLAQALGRTSGGDAPFAVAELEHDYGLLLLRARRRREASRWLLSAQARYTDLGALPFAGRCSRQLREIGVRVSATGTGDEERNVGSNRPTPATLTDQQYRIALLAAEGMTNQQIAGAVFVSVKTVEYHLGNVFAKLGIPSRRQLRAGLEAFL